MQRLFQLDVSDVTNPSFRQVLTPRGTACFSKTKSETVDKEIGRIRMEPLVRPRYLPIAAMLACALLVDSPITPAAHAQTKSLIQDQIRDLNQQIDVESDDPLVNGLLKERGRLLAELMQQNPAAALESALPDGLHQALARRYPEARPWLEEKGEWTGPLVISIAEDSTHRRSKMTQILRVQGHPLSLYWGSPPDAACARSATVRGVRLGNRIAVASVQVAAEAASACATTGNQNTAVLMINYKSHAVTPGYTAELSAQCLLRPGAVAHRLLARGLLRSRQRLGRCLRSLQPRYRLCLQPAGRDPAGRHRGGRFYGGFHRLQPDFPDPARDCRRRLYV